MADVVNLLDLVVDAFDATDEDCTFGLAVLEASVGSADVQRLSFG